MNSPESKLSKTPEQELKKIIEENSTAPVQSRDDENDETVPLNTKEAAEKAAEETPDTDIELTVGETGSTERQMYCFGFYVTHKILKESVEESGADKAKLPKDAGSMLRIRTESIKTCFAKFTQNSSGTESFCRGADKCCEAAVQLIGQTGSFPTMDAVEKKVGLNGGFVTRCYEKVADRMEKLMPPGILKK